MNKIKIPKASIFKTQIPIRITDLNYGNHVGNDCILALIHEARVQFLVSIGYTEFNIENVGIIMRSVSIQFKKEIFYPCQITCEISISALAEFSFSLVYHLHFENKTFVLAETELVFYHYPSQKIAQIPENFKTKMSNSKV